jgi:hypothetical protein
MASAARVQASSEGRARTGWTARRARAPGRPRREPPRRAGASHRRRPARAPRAARPPGRRAARRARAGSGGGSAGSGRDGGANRAVLRRSRSPRRLRRVEGPAPQRHVGDPRPALVQSLASHPGRFASPSGRLPLQRFRS